MRATTFTVILFLAACGGGGGGGDLSGTPGKVGVTGGIAGGYAAIGDIAHVFANPAPTGTVFDHWTGDTGILADPGSWHTVFRLGTSNVSLRAVYVPAPVWTPTQDRVNGQDFWYFVPAAPAGLILFLHGKNGDAPLWFTHPEYINFLRAAVARGYGVAALTASDIGRDWRLEPISPSNPDIRNVVEGWDRLVSEGLITATTPRFVVGLSNGGRFGVRLCSVIGCTAQATVASQGDPPSLMTTTTVPTRFNMLERDTQGQVDEGEAKAYSDQMIARSVRSEFELFGPSPVYPERFARIDGLTIADSRVIHDALAGAGYLDARDFLVEDPYLDASGWHAVIPAPYDGDDTLILIEEQLDNAWSAHGFYGEHLPRTLAFFDALAAERF